MARNVEHALAQTKAELVAARERIAQLELENWRLRSETPSVITPGINANERATGTLHPLKETI